MEESRNGLKDGRGFYDYSDQDVAAYRKARLGAMLAQLRHAGLAKPPR